MYRVNEIFYSLQGEGFWTGTPMVFLRLSGCNLRCPFCDTDHRSHTEMDAETIVSEALRIGSGCRRVCITGGEPSLQLDSALADSFHAAGFRIHVETNGTRPLPEGIDWITLSPKDGIPGAGDGRVVLSRADEVKLVYTGDGDAVGRWAGFPAHWHFLQPCSCSNTAETIACIERQPEVWRLSLQTHKYLEIR